MHQNIRFSDIDQFLQQQLNSYNFSLSKDRKTATPFAEFSHFFKEAGLGKEEELLGAKTWKIIVEEQVDAFPENIFWDFDYMVKCFVDEMKASPSPDLYASNYADQVSRLLRIFGRHSVIKFRYVHDFTYGFDWAKWVKKSPEKRKVFGPFSMPFLSYLEERGQELEELIAEDDDTYHALEEGQEFRNPFRFSREPEAETLLLMLMAKKDLIPVKVWEANTTPSWEPMFAKKREEISVEIGL